MVSLNAGKVNDPPENMIIGCSAFNSKDTTMTHCSRLEYFNKVFYNFSPSTRFFLPAV